MNYKLDDINIYSNSIKELELDLLKILKENKSRQIITLNLDFLRNTKIIDEFRLICKSSEIVLPDGFGITLLLRAKYNTIINRITGNDIFPLLLKIANDNIYRVALIGSTPSVLDKVEIKIKKLYRNLNHNLLCISPKYHFEKNETINLEIVNEIKFFKPDIVFAALGSPRQEIWLYKHMNLFQSKINIGVGAVFDFYSGEIKRSPIFFQNFGLEWLWRLATQPKRLFKRYIFLDLPFLIKSLLLKNY